MTYGVSGEFYTHRRNDHKRFFCPSCGAAQSFQGQSEEDKLRQERDRLKQQLAQKDDEIKWQRERREENQRKVVALKGVVTKTKKRISAGVCPCCNRTFQNLANHMTSMHKEYATDPVTGCTVESCESKIHSRGMCAKHYQQDYIQKRKTKA